MAIVALPLGPLRRGEERDAGESQADTRPELDLRRAFIGWASAIAWPSPVRRRPWTADLVFAGPRVAVFVDGCYWPGCPDHYAVPRTNAGLLGAPRSLEPTKGRDRRRPAPELDGESFGSGSTIRRRCQQWFSSAVGRRMGTSMVTERMPTVAQLTPLVIDAVRGSGGNETTAEIRERVGLSFDASLLAVRHGLSAGGETTTVFDGPSWISGAAA